MWRMTRRRIRAPLETFARFEILGLLYMRQFLLRSEVWRYRICYEEPVCNTKGSPPEDTPQKQCTRYARLGLRSYILDLGCNTCMDSCKAAYSRAAALLTQDYSLQDVERSYTAESTEKTSRTGLTQVAFLLSPRMTFLLCAIMCVNRTYEPVEPSAPTQQPDTGYLPGMYTKRISLSTYSYARFQDRAGSIAFQINQHSLLIPKGYSTKKVLYRNHVINAGTLPYARLTAK